MQRHKHEEAAGETDMLTAARELIVSRHNISPRRLIAPGPSAGQLDELLSLAAAAPDHGALTPWRFILAPADKRHLLAEVFGLALLDRDGAATPEQLEAAREKAFRAPVLLIAVACFAERQPNTPRLERMVSMGAAIQNILLGAHAMGFGAGLTSGRAMFSDRLRALCQLKEGEITVCCLNIGTVSQHKPYGRTRPQPAQFLSTLDPQTAPRR